jgi:hypothetical protein
VAQKALNESLMCLRANLDDPRSVAAYSKAVDSAQRVLERHKEIGNKKPAVLEQEKTSGQALNQQDIYVRHIQTYLAKAKKPRTVYQMQAGIYAFKTTKPGVRILRPILERMEKSGMLNRTIEGYTLKS